jgi:hypothetical protein
MKPLNISELRNRSQARQQRRVNVYNAVLSRCHTKIQTAAENEQFECVYDVPRYIMGLPLYNLDLCIDYLKDRLIANGFGVDYVFPKSLRVHWYPPKEPSNEPDEQPYQIAYKNDRGKFVLNVD